MSGDSDCSSVRYSYTFVLTRFCIFGSTLILLLLIKPCKARNIQNVFSYPQLGHPSAGRDPNLYVILRVIEGSDGESTFRLSVRGLSLGGYPGSLESS